ncbi:a-factor receptor [Lobaria immixta]|nr:a-factor receptor [Lobaria immixta]
MDDKSSGVAPMAVALPVLACITVILDIPPLVWHFKHRNLAATSLVFWVVLSNILSTVNALIWSTDDVSNWWPGLVLCDIEVKLLLATTVGIPGGLACIMRNLALVLASEGSYLVPTRAQRRKRMAFDFFLSIGIPIYIMAIHYVVQPSRYYIFQIAGCLPSADDSWPTVILVWIWPSVLCLICAYYSVLVILRMRKYRQEFSAILSSSGSNLTKSRFKRLFFMTMTLIAIVLPVQFYVLYRNVSFPLIPYDWNAIHGPMWGDVIMVPTGGVVRFDLWIQIAVGFALFVFFGIGKEALNMYRDWLLRFGFGAIFPRLQPVSTRIPSTASTTKGFFSSRARIYFSKRLSTDTVTASFRTNSESIYPSTPSPRELQKSFPLLGTISEHESNARPEASNRARSITDDEKASPAASAPKPVPLFVRIIGSLHMPTALAHISLQRPPGSEV